MKLVPMLSGPDLFF